MRARRIGAAVFMAAAAISGVWVLAGPPDDTTTVGSEAPSPSATAAPPAEQLTVEEFMRRMTDTLSGQPLCPRPPATLTAAQQQAVERALATVPPPPTVPGDAPAAVTNVHVPVAPC